jgi:hypothetical protein
MSFPDDASAKSFFIMGMPDASPMFNIPVFTVTLSDIPFCTFPITLSFSDKAFSGQNNAHPPQEWQTSSNIFNVPLM